MTHIVAKLKTIGGNPMKAKEKLEKKVTFRITKSEGEQLDQVAKLLGCRPSDAMRWALTSVTCAAQ